MGWAAKLAREGKDWKHELQGAADTGSIAHFRVECFLRSEEPDLIEFTEEEIRASDIAYERFLEFWAKAEMEPIAIEAQLTSEIYGYGGTLDLIGRNPDSDFFLFDWKTSKAIYDSHLFQCSGYYQLWNENQPDMALDRACIVRMGKDKKSGFEQRWITKKSMGIYWDVFLCQLNLLKAKQNIRAQ
jgi:hypothetical protein